MTNEERAWWFASFPPLSLRKWMLPSHFRHEINFESRDANTPDETRSCKVGRHTAVPGDIGSAVPASELNSGLKKQKQFKPEECRSESPSVETEPARQKKMQKQQEEQ